MVCPTTAPILIKDLKKQIIAEVIKHELQVQFQNEKLQREKFISLSLFLEISLEFKSFKDCCRDCCLQVLQYLREKKMSLKADQRHSLQNK